MHRDCRGHHDGAWTGIARVGVGPAAGRVVVLRAYVGHDKHQRRAGAEPAPFARVGGRAQRTGTPRYTIDVSSTSERSGPCVGTTLTLLTHRRPARPPNGHPHHRDRRRPRPLLRRVQLPEQRHARADGRRVQRPPRALRRPPRRDWCRATKVSGRRRTCGTGSGGGSYGAGIPTAARRNRIIDLEVRRPVTSQLLLHTPRRRGLGAEGWLEPRGRGGA